MNYNFVETKNQFGIIWFSDEGEEIGTDWYDSEEDRLSAVDLWYAQEEDVTNEQ